MTARSPARRQSGPWLGVAVTLVLAVLLPIVALPVGVITAIYAHSAGVANARNAAVVITVIAAVLALLVGAGGTVEGGFS